MATQSHGREHWKSRACLSGVAVWLKAGEACAEHKSPAEAQTPPEVSGKAGCFREGGGSGEGRR